MEDDETTTIKVKGVTWRQLNRMKEPGDSFDDVIQRLLEEGEEGNPNRAVATAD